MATVSRAAAPARLAYGLAVPANFSRADPAAVGDTDDCAGRGIEAKRAAAGSPIAHGAYGLATSFQENARAMQPVEEVGRRSGKAYGKHGRQHAYGRADVELK